jgi:type III secretion protein V
LTPGGCLSIIRVMAGQQRAQNAVALLQGGDVASFLRRYSDIALAGVVVLIVAMMIIPLPTFILDLLISFNIAVAVILLLVAIYISDALKIATFPTLLLLTTLFRLALEVSATRLILLHADAGEVIHAFGNFVVAGNLVVGAVIFFILTIIQFIVISKGSERVAEVGARFTLDAMPGKQMSIDAELRSGHIDHNEARRRRAVLNRESQFFGSMDGAMKFVKGDAIAGIIVLLTNIIGGLVIGIVQRGMDAGTAARTYTVLTIGEGLVAQIPALVISTAAGIIVTRVSSEEEGSHLGHDIGGQLLGQPKALAIAAALLALLAIVPGLPTLPFLVLALAIGFVAWRLMRATRLAEAAVALADADGASPGAEGPAGKSAVAQAARSEAHIPLLTPIIIELAPALGSRLSPDNQGGTFVRQRVPLLREQIFNELGIVLPAVRLKPNVQSLAPNGYAIRLQEVSMGRGELVVDGGFVAESPERLAELGLSGQAGSHAVLGKGTWLAGEDLVRAQASTIATLSPEEVILRHIHQLVRRYGYEFIGIQETQTLLEGLERSHPALVREVVPKLVTPVLLTDILRRLAEEGVSLRSLREILGALADWAPLEKDPVALTEHVRSALRRQITAKHTGTGGVLAVYLLEPMIEETIRESIHKTPTGSYLALEPALSRDILAAVGRALGAGAVNPVILTSAELRRYVRRLVEAEYPQVAVLSYQELAPETQLQPLGRIRIA